ncbi:uncharacterized protein NPIL_351731 [Nephila pilipes]|uniref:Uncharacterized protein n=1 Tax=Nephila pilipes TaxID=299642 RepID=A0A8X6URY1_NEPPI|nr:uncharacterized protein NPIL_351731 [Nephila pilipes]
MAANMKDFLAKKRAQKTVLTKLKQKLSEPNLSLSELELLRVKFKNLQDELNSIFDSIINLSDEVMSKKNNLESSSVNSVSEYSVVSLPKISYPHSREKYVFEILDSCIYVDDLTTGANDLIEALKLSRGVKEIMSKANMNLRKWVLNYINLVKESEDEKYDIHPILNDSNVPKLKVLGIQFVHNCRSKNKKAGSLKVEKIGLAEEFLVKYEQRVLSGARMSVHEIITNSSLISEQFKGYMCYLVDVYYMLFDLMFGGLYFTFCGYFSFVCYCIKLLFREFVLRSEILIQRDDYYTVIQIYREVNQMMISVDAFISYCVFINVVGGMSALFWSWFNFVVTPKEDFLSFSYLSLMAMGLTARLLLIMLSASSTNQAAEVPRSIIASLPGWFPRQYKKVKIYVRKEFKHPAPALTLWKIYKIDKSLLIRAIGMLITYGIILGTLGTVKESTK